VRGGGPWSRFHLVTIAQYSEAGIQKVAGRTAGRDKTLMQLERDEDMGDDPVRAATVNGATT